MDQEQLLRRFLSAYEDKKLETIAEMLSNDVVLRDWNHQVEGKAGALLQFTKNFEGSEALAIQIRNIYSSKNAIAAEIEIAIGDTETLRVVDILGLNEGGQILSIISYKGL